MIAKIPKITDIKFTYRFDIFTSIFCFLFSVTILFSILSPGDGGWILFGKELQNHSLLYENLNFHQQPLFPFLGKLVSTYSNDKFFLEKSFFLFIPITYIYAIYKISQKAFKSRLIQSFFILSVFFASIQFEAFRFDDYHGFSGALKFLSLYISIIFLRSEIKFNAFINFQSIIASLVFFSQITEGVFLFCVIYGIGFYKECRIRLLIYSLFKTFIIFFSFFIFFVFFLSDTSIQNWFSNTITEAGSIKGGDGLYFYPFKMIVNSVKAITIPFFSGHYFLKLFLLLFYLLGIFILLNYKKLIRFKYISEFFIFFIFSFGFFIQEIYNLKIISVLLPYSFIFSLFIFIAYLAYLFSRNFQRDITLNKTLCLILYPLCFFISGSLSSGGSFNDHYFSMALFLAVFPFIINSSFIKKGIPNGYLNLISLVFLVVAIQGYTARYNNPYSWHSYHVPKLFFKYKFVYSSLHGHFITNDEVEALIDPVCKLTDGPSTLLSIPFSFANYYCGKKIWEGNIQTFFDTSSEIQVKKIIEKLKIDPPNFIFYQRQLANLKLHEEIYRNGKALPHRKLDEFIMNEIEGKKWLVIYTSKLYPPSEWILIATK
jgi:hypothetical protein